MAQKLINGPQSRAPSRWGESAKNLTASRHQGCLNNVPFKTQSKAETGERRETMDGKWKEEGERLRIGTWNVRSLNKFGRSKEVKQVMERYRLNILGVSEVRWKGQG